MMTISGGITTCFIMFNKNCSFVHGDDVDNEKDSGCSVGDNSKWWLC